MESLHGKQTSTLDGTDFATRLHGYQQIVIDIGTGDGRYAAHLARSSPERLVIGIDTCRENLAQVTTQCLVPASERRSPVGGAVGAGLPYHGQFPVG